MRKRLSKQAKNYLPKQGSRTQDTRECKAGNLAYSRNYFEPATQKVTKWKSVGVIAIVLL